MAEITAKSELPAPATYPIQAKSTLEQRAESITSDGVPVADLGSSDVLTEDKAAHKVEVINTTSGADKYIVVVDGVQTVLGKSEIEALGGSVPVAVERENILHQTEVEQGREARMAQETLFRQQDAARALSEAEDMSYDAALATIQRFEQQPTSPEFVNASPDVIATLAGVSRVPSAGLENLSRARADRFATENVQVGVQMTSGSPQYVSKADYEALQRSDPTGAEVLFRGGFDAYQDRVRDIQREQVAQYSTGAAKVASGVAVLSQAGLLDAKGLLNPAAFGMADTDTRIRQALRDIGISEKDVDVGIVRYREWQESEPERYQQALVDWFSENLAMSKKAAEKTIADYKKNPADPQFARLPAESIQALNVAAQMDDKTNLVVVGKDATGADLVVTTAEQKKRLEQLASAPAYLRKAYVEGGIDGYNTAVREYKDVMKEVQSRASEPSWTTGQATESFRKKYAEMLQPGSMSDTDYAKIAPYIIPGKGIYAKGAYEAGVPVDVITAFTLATVDQETRDKVQSGKALVLPYGGVVPVEVVSGGVVDGKTVQGMTSTKRNILLKSGLPGLEAYEAKTIADAQAKSLWDSIIDPLIVMSTGIGHGVKQFVNVELRGSVRDVKEGDLKPEYKADPQLLQAAILSAKLTGSAFNPFFTAEEATQENALLKTTREKLEKAYNDAEDVRREWIDSHPDLQPVYPGGPLDAVKSNPAAILDARLYAETIAGTIPYTVPLALIAIGGATAGPAGIAAAAVPAFGLTMAVEGHDIYEDALANGASKVQAKNLMNIYGAISASIETVGDAFFAGTLGLASKSFAKRLSQDTAEGVIRAAAKKYGWANLTAATMTDFINQAGQEALQEITRNVAIKQVNANQDLLENAMDAFVAGAIGTAPFVLLPAGGQAFQIMKQFKSDSTKIETALTGMKKLSASDQNAVLDRVLQPAEGFIGSTTIQDSATRKEAAALYNAMGAKVGEYATIALQLKQTRDAINRIGVATGSRVKETLAKLKELETDLSSKLDELKDPMTESVSEYTDKMRSSVQGDEKQALLEELSDMPKTIVKDIDFITDEIVGLRTADEVATELLKIRTEVGGLRTAVQKEREKTKETPQEVTTAVAAIDAAIDTVSATPVGRTLMVAQDAIALVNESILRLRAFIDTGGVYDLAGKLANALDLAEDAIIKTKLIMEQATKDGLYDLAGKLASALDALEDAMLQARIFVDQGGGYEIAYKAAGKIAEAMDKVEGSVLATGVALDTKAFDVLYSGAGYAAKLADSAEDALLRARVFAEQDLPSLTYTVSGRVASVLDKADDAISLATILVKNESFNRLYDASGKLAKAVDAAENAIDRVYFLLASGEVSDVVAKKLAKELDRIEDFTGKWTLLIKNEAFNKVYDTSGKLAKAIDDVEDMTLRARIYLEQDLTGKVYDTSGVIAKALDKAEDTIGQLTLLAQNEVFNRTYDASGRIAATLDSTEDLILKTRVLLEQGAIDKPYEVAGRIAATLDKIEDTMGVATILVKNEAFSRAYDIAGKIAKGLDVTDDALLRARVFVEQELPSRLYDTAGKIAEELDRIEDLVGIAKILVENESFSKLYDVSGRLAVTLDWTEDELYKIKMRLDSGEDLYRVSGAVAQLLDRTDDATGMLALLVKNEAFSKTYDTAGKLAKALDTTEDAALRTRIYLEQDLVRTVYDLAGSIASGLDRTDSLGTSIAYILEFGTFDKLYTVSGEIARTLDKLDDNILRARILIDSGELSSRLATKLAKVVDGAEDAVLRGRLLLEQTSFDEVYAVAGKAAQVLDEIEDVINADIDKARLAKPQIAALKKLKAGINSLNTAYRASDRDAFQKAMTATLGAIDNTLSKVGNEGALKYLDTVKTVLGSLTPDLTGDYAAIVDRYRVLLPRWFKLRAEAEKIKERTGEYWEDTKDGKVVIGNITSTLEQLVKVRDELRGHSATGVAIANKETLERLETELGYFTAVASEEVSRPLWSEKDYSGRGRDYTGLLARLRDSVTNLAAILQKDRKPLDNFASGLAGLDIPQETITKVISATADIADAIAGKTEQAAKRASKELGEQEVAARKKDASKAFDDLKSVVDADATIDPAVKEMILDGGRRIAEADPLQTVEYTRGLFSDIAGVSDIRISVQPDWLTLWRGSENVGRAYRLTVQDIQSRIAGLKGKNWKEVQTELNQVKDKLQDMRDTTFTEREWSNFARDVLRQEKEKDKVPRSEKQETEQMQRRWTDLVSRSRSLLEFEAASLLKRLEKGGRRAAETDRDAVQYEADLVETERAIRKAEKEGGVAESQLAKMREKLGELQEDVAIRREIADEAKSDYKADLSRVYEKLADEFFEGNRNHLEDFLQGERDLQGNKIEKREVAETDEGLPDNLLVGDELGDLDDALQEIERILRENKDKPPSSPSPDVPPILPERGGGRTRVAVKERTETKVQKLQEEAEELTEKEKKSLAERAKEAERKRKLAEEVEKAKKEVAEEKKSKEEAEVEVTTKKGDKTVMPAETFSKMAEKRVRQQFGEEMLVVDARSPYVLPVPDKQSAEWLSPAQAVRLAQQIATQPTVRATPATSVQPAVSPAISVQPSTAIQPAISPAVSPATQPSTQPQTQQQQQLQQQQRLTEPQTGKKLFIPPILFPKKGGSEGSQQEIPAGSIAYKKGMFWKWIPPEDFRDGVKPRTLPRGVSPIGADLSGGNSPYATIQRIGISSVAVPERISVDEGVVDAFITGKGDRIGYSGGGEETDVGERIAGTTQGMTVDGDDDSTLRPTIASKSTKARNRDDDVYFDEDPDWLKNLEPSILQTKKRSVNRAKIDKRKSKRGGSPATTVGGMRLR